MTSSQQKIACTKLSLTDIAKASDVRVQDISHYLRGNKHKVGKHRWKRITTWMIQNGHLSPPKPKEMCVCPFCGGKHVKRKHSKSTE